MSTKDDSLQQALRLLLLPLRADNEMICVKTFEDFITQNNIKIEDIHSWVSYHLGEWEESGKPSLDLKNATKLILGAGDCSYGVDLGDKYFIIYDKIREAHFFSHSEARSFLSHALLMLDLAINEKLSAAQIAKLLKERDRRVSFSRQSVNDFLTILKRKPKLEQSLVEELYKKDLSDSDIILTDADDDFSARFISDEALMLGMPQSIYEDLRALFMLGSDDNHVPYIQMLHYQCVIAEFYDHAITDLYEFAPRGNTAKWLFAQYGGFASGNEPFLNNSKAVEQISPAWVRARDFKERRNALGLYNILYGLETMGFTARRELARLLRVWACRAIEISKPLQHQIPNLRDEQWDIVLSSVSTQNTKTYGILEQRVVDAVTAFLHPQASNWRARGLGASVNATNISQKKFGDCDFQNPHTNKIVAYEAHGGKLSNIYVQDHLRTLKNVCSARVEELSGIADINYWEAYIYFIAHELSSDLQDIKQDINGLTVIVSYLTFADFIDRARTSSIPYSFFDNYVLTHLNRKNTPHKVRSTVLSMI